MAVAFLVLAHDQPDHVARLVHVLGGDGARFFVHVDARVDAAPFRARLDGRPDVVLVEPRIAVHWAGFSLVRATLRLVAAAAGRFARYCLLSGADYPIKPRAAVLAALEDPAREWMMVGRALGPGDPQYGCVARWHWNDVALLNPRTRPGTRLGRRARRVVRPLAAHLAATLPARRFPDGLTPYKGSQWWALSEPCLAWIRDYLRAHPAYERFHRHVHCADEIFFHSLVKASPFAARISCDLDAGRDGPPLTRVDWVGEQPRVLEGDDVAALVASPALFARKFDVGRSQPLLARLDAALGFEGGG